MDGGGWIGLASIAVTGVLGLLTLLVNKRYDQKTTALQNQNTQQAVQIAALTDQHAECKEDHAATQAKLDDCEKRHDTIEARVAQIEHTIADRK